MKNKYPSIRLPFEVKENFSKKQEVLKQIAMEENIKKRITFTDTLRFFSQMRVPVYNTELVKFINENKRIRKKIKCNIL